MMIHSPYFIREARTVYGIAKPPTSAYLQFQLHPSPLREKQSAGTSILEVARQPAAVEAAECVKSFGTPVDGAMLITPIDKLLLRSPGKSILGILLNPVTGRTQ
jgi:hypothetical protein